jgi:hypothetical protein
MARREGGSYLRAAVSVEPGRACSTQPAAALASLPLPSMPAPAGAVAGRASMGGTADSLYSAIRLETRETVQAVSAHYANQLAAAGWTVEGQAADAAAMAVTRLRTTGAAGERVTAVLVVTAIEGTGAIDVLLRLVAPHAMAASGIR